MIEFVIAVSKFYFLFLIVYFLWLGIKYILSERGHARFNMQQAANSQVVIIILTILFAILIVAYSPADLEPENGFYFPFNLQYLLYGLGILAFVIIGRITTRRIYARSCPLMWNGMFYLLAIGFIMLLRLNADLAYRQLIFSTAGMIVMLFVPLALKIIPKFEKLEYVYMGVGLALLIGVLFVGTSAYGATNWLAIKTPYMNIMFQPSEFVKIVFVFYLASALRVQPGKKKLLFICAYGAVIVGLLVIQKDLGGAMIFFMIFMVMVYAATGNKLLLAAAFGSVALIIFFAWQLAEISPIVNKLISHALVRVNVWQDPWADISGDGYQITQSLFAITSWGPFGSGLTAGAPSRIPVVERDFIFSAICEEFGGIFALTLLGVYIMVYYRGIHIALKCKKPLYSLLSLGFVSLLAFQTFVILGGDIKLIPMTGVTMPFVSYGGSSVFISIIMIGVLEWLYIRIPEDGQKRRRRAANE